MDAYYVTAAHLAFVAALATVLAAFAAFVVFACLVAMQDWRAEYERQRAADDEKVRQEETTRRRFAESETVHWPERPGRWR